MRKVLTYQEKMSNVLRKKHKSQLKYVLYHAWVGAILIVVNIYFLLFVHNLYDLSPNFALLIATIPLAYIEFKKATKEIMK